jgi:hypothetical protein
MSAALACGFRLLREQSPRLGHPGQTFGESFRPVRPTLHPVGLSGESDAALVFGYALIGGSLSMLVFQHELQVVHGHPLIYFS